MRRGEAGRKSWLKRLQGLESGLDRVWTANRRILNITCLVCEVGSSQERKMRHEQHWAHVPVTRAGTCKCACYVELMRSVV